MYEFHYNYIGVTYGCGAKLLLKDTDSLVYRTESDDVYEIHKSINTKVCLISRLSNRFTVSWYYW